MFQWKKEFDLGIPSIDMQHKKLFEIGNRIYDLLTLRSDDSNDFDEINSVIIELKEYVKLHFKTEEELLLKYNYPDIEEHMKEHADFTEYLDTLVIDDMNCQQKQFLKNLFNRLANWVFFHIITTDFLYKDYLIGLGKK